MYCARCGTKNEDGARFCKKCGAEIVYAKTTKEPIPTKPIHNLELTKSMQEPVKIKPVKEHEPVKPVQELVPEMPAQEPIPEMPVQDPVPEMPAQEPAPEMPAQEPVPEMPVQEPIPEMPVQDPVPEMPAQEPAPEMPAQEPDKNTRSILMPILLGLFAVLLFATSFLLITRGKDLFSKIFGNKVPNEVVATMKEKESEEDSLDDKQVESEEITASKEPVVNEEAIEEDDSNKQQNTGNTYDVIGDIKSPDVMKKYEEIIKKADSYFEQADGGYGGSTGKYGYALVRMMSDDDNPSLLLRKEFDSENEYGSYKSYVIKVFHFVEKENRLIEAKDPIIDDSLMPDRSYFRLGYAELTGSYGVGVFSINGATGDTDIFRISLVGNNIENTSVWSGKANDEIPAEYSSRDIIWNEISVKAQNDDGVDKIKSPGVKKQYSRVIGNPSVFFDNPTIRNISSIRYQYSIAQLNKSDKELSLLIRQVINYYD